MATITSTKITKVDRVNSSVSYTLEVRVVSTTTIDPLAFVNTVSSQSGILVKSGLPSSLFFVSAKNLESGTSGSSKFWDVEVVFSPDEPDTTTITEDESVVDPVTITADGSREAFVVKDTDGNLFSVTSEGDVVVGKNLKWETDDQYDIGTSDGGSTLRRPKNIYAGSDVYAAGDVTAARSLVDLSQTNQYRFNPLPAIPDENSGIRYLYWNQTDNTLRFWDGTEEKILDEPGAGGADPDAIHDNQASEISAIVEKVTPVAADLILIEDSTAANVKKKIQIGNLPGGGGDPWIEDEFTPSNGQITFILSQAPSDANSFSLLVNGVLADDVVDYTVSGTNLTWLNNLFVLDTGDKLLARYV
jgi:hypothetical protein